MHKFQHLLCLTLFSTLFTFISSAQLAPVDALKKLYDQYPQEKIYMWFNKPEYVAGETCWFKVYVFSGYQLSDISKTVYVELYNRDRQVVNSGIFPLVSGVAQGSFDLGEKFSEDVYYIRAYTRWMMNFDQSLEYIRPLVIYNPASSSHLIKKNIDWTPSIHAEGNTLINGIQTKMAIRLSSDTDLPSSWSGTVYESGNETVTLAEFKSFDKNVASFYLTPETGKKYTAVIKDNAGRSKTIQLPLPRSGGIAMQVQNAGDTIVCRVLFSGASDGKNYSVVGQMQHQMVYSAKFKQTSALIKLPIPVKEMYNGILHLTLFDEANNIVAERLVFTNPDKLYIDSTSITRYDYNGKPRGSSEIEVRVDSMTWNSFAMSVTDAELRSSVESENILSAIWLTSDLSGRIHDGAAYFRGNKINEEALDALLITEKVKTFQWFNILKNNFPTLKYYPHNYLSYTGIATRNKKLLPSKEITFILYAPDSSNQLLLGRTDSTGTIIVENFAFEGEIKAFYQLNEKKGNPKNIDIRFERNNKPFPLQGRLPVSEYTLSPRVSASVPRWIQNTRTSINNEKDVNDQYKTLEEVVIRSTKKTAKEQLVEKLTSGIFRGHNDMDFDFINENQNGIAYSNILEWLNGRVAGLSMQFEDGVLVPYIRGHKAGIFLDEMPFDSDGLANISVSDIALVKVIKGPMSFVTGGGAGGSIAVYTTKGNMRPAQREPSLNNNVLVGYNDEKLFYSPDYSVKEVKHPAQDLRTQLLWTSLMVPGNSLTQSVHRFVNNDKPGNLRVIIQGVTEKGFPVFVEKIITPVASSF